MTSAPNSTRESATMNELYPFWKQKYVKFVGPQSPHGPQWRLPSPEPPEWRAEA